MSILLFWLFSVSWVLVAINVLTVGQTTSGKSTVKCRDIVLEALRGLTSIVVLDPHKNSLARWVCTHLLARGLEHRVLYDQLSHLQRALGWSWLERSNAKDELTRRAENDERMRSIASLICWQRDTSHLGPQTAEWIEGGLNLLLHQEDEADLADLDKVLIPGHPTVKRLVDGCTDAELARKFRDVANKKVARGTLAPAYRAAADVTRSPSLQLRSVRSIDAFAFEQFLGNPDDPGILLIEGGSDGNVSFESMRVMLGAVIRAIARRKLINNRVLSSLREG